MPHLTTIIPVYNGERYILETLRSVAAQTRPPDRLIVLDNLSTDRTREIVEEFPGLRCEWRQNEANLGLFGNLNRALEFASTTDFLHLLHADDNIKPRFYATSIAALEKINGRGLSSSRVQLIDSHGAAIGTAPNEEDFRYITPGEFIKKRAELQAIYFPSVLLQTDRKRSPCFFRPEMPHLADNVFWAEWAHHCAAIVETGKVLAEYRMHEAADTVRNMRNLDGWVTDEWRAMDLISQFGQARGITSFLWRQKLKFIFAARCAVKKRILAKHAELAEQVRLLALRQVSPFHWNVGQFVAMFSRFPVKKIAELAD